MNEKVNKFLVAGGKFMPEMYLQQPGFTYSACGPFTESKERIQKFKEIGDSQYIYQNKLDKACFQHEMAYGDFKVLTRRTASDKICMIKHLILLKSQNIMDINMDLLQCSISFLIKNLLRLPINLLLVVVLKMRIFQTKNELNNYINQLLENSRKEKYSHLL